LLLFGFGFAGLWRDGVGLTELSLAESVLSFLTFIQFNLEPIFFKIV
jgi:hypothetical protein